MFSFLDELEYAVLKPDVTFQLDKQNRICEHVKLCYPVMGFEITKWRNIADSGAGGGIYDIDTSVADFLSAVANEKSGGYAIQSANSGGAGTPTPLTSVSVGRNFSLSFWISPIASPPSYGTIFAQNASTGIYLRSTGAIDFFSGADHNTTTTLVVGKWHHVVVVCDETTVVYYIDGVKDATTFTGASTFTFNRVFNDSSSEKLAAKLDLLTYWDRPLSAAQVQQLFRNPTVMLLRPFGVDNSLLFLSGAFAPDSTQNITGSAGITSGETFGSGGVVAYSGGPLVGVTGIPTGESFGTPGILAGPIVGVSGIISAEAFGAGALSAIVGTTGIPTEEVFGSGGTVGSVSGPLTGNAGITSGEAFGTPGIVAGPIVGDAGIPTAEAFGVGTVTTLIIGLTGIPSAEVFGTPGILLRGISGLIGIPTGEFFGSSGAVLQLDPTYSNFSLYLAKQNRIVYLVANTLRVERQLNFQAAAHFTLYDESGGYEVAIGTEVVVYYYDYDGDQLWHRIFAGTVQSIEKTRNVTGLQTWQQVSCSDYAKALSRRLLNMKYPQDTYGTLTKIMNDISDRILEPEGIFWDNKGDPGVVFQDLEFSYQPTNEVLDRLAELANWDWQVDFFKNLRIYDRPSTALTAPFNIVESPVSEVWRNLSVRRDRGLYRNRQYIKANFSRSTTTEVRTYTCPEDKPIPPYDYLLYWGLTDYGSGLFRAPFLNDTRLAGRVERIVSITLNAVDQPFYTQQLPGSPGTTPPPGWKWVQLWGRDLQILYNIQGVPVANWPQAGDVLVVTVETLNDLPAPVVEENSAEILARQAIEGGTGVYEAMEEVIDIQDRNLLVTYAQQLLARFSTMGLEVDLETDKFGFEPGQELTVNLPLYAVGSLLVNVESTSYQEISKKVLRSQVKISNQIQQRDALTAFHRLIKRLRKPANKAQFSFTFDLAVTYPGITNPGLSVGVNLTNEYLVRHENGITLKEVSIFFKTAPTLADIIINIKADGTTIFAAGTVANFPAGATTVQSHTSFSNAPRTLLKGTRVTIDVTQIGSGQPGKDGTVTVIGWT